MDVRAAIACAALLSIAVSCGRVKRPGADGESDAAVHDGAPRDAPIPDADPLDLICHLAFNAPLRTRRERAQRLRTDRQDFFDQFGPDARQILDELLDKYTEHGTAQFVIPEVLELPPINAHGNVIEIAARFGGVEQLRHAVIQLQTLLYAAA